MVIGILILAMLAGFGTAALALVAGHSILFALAAYSVAGSVTAVVVGISIAATGALRDRSDATLVRDRTA